MAKCSTCGASVWRLDMINGMCGPCAAAASTQQRVSDSRTAAEAAAAETARREAFTAQVNSLILTTETAPVGLNITQRIGVVSAQCAFGMHLFKDAFTEIRDIVGGRSRSLEKTLGDARDTAMGELKIKAAELGADAVIAIDFDFSEFGRSAILAIATGTAVKLSPSTDQAMDR